jgi:hypothetical protein
MRQSSRQIRRANNLVKGKSNANAAASQFSHAEGLAAPHLVQLFLD